jgi:hypothetical protein
VSTPNTTVSAPVETEVGGGAAPAETGVATGGPDLRVVHAMPVSSGTSTAGAGTVAAPTPTVSTPADGGSTWLPVAEAAERTSVSESALRKWIKAGELVTRDAPGPRGLRTEVTVEAVIARARQAGMEVGPRAGLDLADAFTRLENLTGQLVAAGERAARAEVERDHVKRRVEELRAEAARSVEGERRRADAERSRLDALGAELSAAREALIAERARADAMLAAVPRRKRHLFARPASGVPGTADGTSGAAGGPPGAGADLRA